MSPAPDGTVSIKEVSWEEIKAAGGAKGWYYPQTYISQWMPFYRPVHRNIISFFILLTFVILIAGIIFSVVMGDWAYLLVILGSFVSWKLNRYFLKRFFLVNMSKNEAFYNRVRDTEMADIVKVLL